MMKQQTGDRCHLVYGWTSGGPPGRASQILKSAYSKKQWNTTRIALQAILHAENWGLRIGGRKTTLSTGSFLKKHPMPGL